jgi:anti-repressor protein
MTNNLLSFDPPAQTVTMNSVEIAELVGSRHDKVKQSIERLVEKSVIACPPLGVMVETVNNRNYESQTYVFSGKQGRLDSIVVVAQLMPEVTARLVARWDELETEKASGGFQIPKTLGEALQLAANLETERVKAVAAAEQATALADKRKEVIESQKPHVAFSTALLASDKSTSLAETAQLMNSDFRKFGRNTLVQQLLTDYYLTREGSQRRLRPSQYALDRNLFELKSTEFVNDDGAVLINHQVFITPKGLAHFIDRYVTKPKAEQAAELKREKEQRTGGLFKRQAA